MYQKITIYYFTGTGNSGNVAQWFSKIAAEKAIPCELIHLSPSNRRAIPLPEEDALVVFISPIHGFNYPPVMLNFITHFPKGKNKVVLMNTRAGMLLGKLITPGLTGIAFYLAMGILRFKGYAMAGTLPVDLPSNWISIHPGLNQPTVKYLHTKNKERVTDFVAKILSGQTVFKGRGEWVQDVLVAPISLLYYLFGRFMLAKTYYASADCNNCGICVANCPVRAIIRVDNRPYWTFKCENCMRCMSNCPKRAIETAHGFIAVVLFVFSYFLSHWLYPTMTTFLFEIPNGLLQFIFKWTLFFIIITALYRLMHYCLRFKLFERIMVYTSLTKHQFWGQRYKALNDTE